MRRGLRHQPIGCLLFRSGRVVSVFASFFFFDSVGGANGLGFLLAFRPASLVSLAAPLNSRLPRVVVAVVVVVVVVVVVDSCVRRRNICRPCVTLSVRVNSSIVVFVLRFVNIRRCVATLLKPKY